MRFSVAIIGLILLLAACGPKPEFKVATDGSPKAVWELFLSRIADNDSIAIQGKIKLISDKSYQFGFEAYYLNRDTLNFTAHGPMGAGWVRLLLLGDSVYITNSKDRIPVLFNKNDRIYFGDLDNQIIVSAMLKALFFTSPEPESEFAGHESGHLIYRYGGKSDMIETYINPDNCFPVKRVTRTADDIYQTKYFAWKMVNKNQFYPTKIIMESSCSRGSMQLKINNIKINAKLPRRLFLNNF